MLDKEERERTEAIQEVAFAKGTDQGDTSGFPDFVSTKVGAVEGMLKDSMRDLLGIVDKEEQDRKDAVQAVQNDLSSFVCEKVGAFEEMLLSSVKEVIGLLDKEVQERKDAVQSVQFELGSLPL